MFQLYRIKKKTSIVTVYTRAIYWGCPVVKCMRAGGIGGQYFNKEVNLWIQK